MRVKLFFFFALICCTSALSQTLKFNYGPSISRVHLNFMLEDRPITDFYDKSLWGSSINVGLELKEDSLFSYTASLYFYKCGGDIAEKDIRDFGPDDTLKPPGNYNYNMLSFGPELNFNPLLRDKFKVQITLGPRIDYMTYGYSEILHKVYFGLTTGIALTTKVNHIEFGIFGKYLSYFTGLLTSNEAAPYYSLDAKMNVFHIGFTLGIKLNTKIEKPRPQF